MGGGGIGGGIGAPIPIGGAGGIGGSTVSEDSASDAVGVVVVADFAFAASARSASTCVFQSSSMMIFLSSAMATLAMQADPRAWPAVLSPRAS